MGRWLQATISALAYTLADEHVPPHIGVPAAIKNGVARRLAGQLNRMMGPLRAPMLLATTLFGISTLLGYGRTFSGLAPDVRLRVLTSWRTSRLGAFRDFVRFYDSLGLLLTYDSMFQAGLLPARRAEALAPVPPATLQRNSLGHTA